MKATLAAHLCLIGALFVLAGCGSSEPTTDLRVAELAIDSRAVGEELDVSVIKPAAGGDIERPLLVFLHGAGGSNESFVANRAVLAAITGLGEEAPVVAFPEGEESWWHKRESGDWERYVVREVIPAVSRRFDADPRRVAIGGISMGGFGAYHLGLAYPGRFCAVGGHSAGLWPHPGEEFPGAFDDQDDYERNDVLAAVEADPGAYGSTPVWNDYGDADWFVLGNAAFVAALQRGDAHLTARVWPGGHDAAYWDAHWPAYLRFYASALAAC
jgi:enterochelin esterase-like enzyme